MDLLFIVALIALLGGIAAYTIINHYTTSRRVRGWVVIIAVILTIPLLGLAIYVIFGSSYSETTKMWAMGVGALSVGFWLKNPTKDFVDG